LENAGFAGGAGRYRVKAAAFSMFWRLFPASFRREGQKRLCFGGCFRRFGVLVVVYASCRREGEGEEEEREYDGIKTDLTVKIEI